MAIPWTTLASVAVDDGVLELRRRGEKDFLITFDGLVLMNSLANRSEVVLGELGCRHLADHPAPRVLVGGLGMGCTLRAVLDSLPASASVTVAELNPVIVDWCRGPLAALTGGAVDDPRVSVAIGDVAELVRRHGQAKAQGFDAVVYDLYKGPHFRTDPVRDPLYGSRAIAGVRAVLRPGGVFAVWGECYDEGFVERLQRGGFDVTTRRPGRGGLRHAVFLAELKGEPVRRSPGPRGGKA